MEKEILKQFFNEQARNRNYDGGEDYILSDECYLITYSQLKIDKKIAKPILLELRNNGIIELSPAVDYDGVPNGSGYMLTQKGLAHCLSLGIREE